MFQIKEIYLCRPSILYGKQMDGRTCTDESMKHRPFLTRRLRLRLRPSPSDMKPENTGCSLSVILKVSGIVKYRVFMKKRAKSLFFRCL